MKKLLTILILIIFSAACCTVATPEGQDSEVGKILKGKHYLNKLPSGTYYDLIDDGVNVQTHIKFAKQSIIYTFEIHKVRFEETTDKPYAKFLWKQGNTHHLDEILREHVINVVICLPKDVPTIAFTDDGTFEYEEDYTEALIEGESEEKSTLTLPSLKSLTNEK